MAAWGSSPFEPPVEFPVPRATRPEPLSRPAESLARAAPPLTAVCQVLLCATRISTAVLRRLHPVKPPPFSQVEAPHLMAAAPTALKRKEAERGWPTKLRAAGLYQSPPTSALYSLPCRCLFTCSPPLSMEVLKLLRIK